MPKMILDLKKLKPNPLRDFSVDPIDPEKIAMLKRSIQEDGFWGGIVCRRLNGNIEIAAGHHRVNAAIEAGITKADLMVMDDADDARMIRIYAVENATQRGNTVNAQAGTVASAVRFLAKQIITGDVVKIFTTLSPHQLEILQGDLATDKGVGRSIILEFLEGVEGMNLGVINQQLANLKASGHYAQIIGQVRDEIAREQQAELKRLAHEQKEQEEAERLKAEKAKELSEAAAKKSAEKTSIFDFDGVSKIISNAHQLQVFRKAVTSKGYKDYIPLKQQAKLAAQLVEEASRMHVEFSGRFIKEQLSMMVSQARFTERKLRKEERERLKLQGLRDQVSALHKQFVSLVNRMAVVGVKIENLEKTFPKGFAYPITGEFRAAVKDGKKVIDHLLRRIS